MMIVYLLLALEVSTFHFPLLGYPKIFIILRVFFLLHDLSQFVLTALEKFTSTLSILCTCMFVITTVKRVLKYVIEEKNEMKYEAVPQ